MKSSLSQGRRSGVKSGEAASAPPHGQAKPARGLLSPANTGVHGPLRLMWEEKERQQVKVSPPPCCRSESGRLGGGALLVHAAAQPPSVAATPLPVHLNRKFRKERTDNPPVALFPGGPGSLAPSPIRPRHYRRILVDWQGIQRAKTNNLGMNGIKARGIETGMMRGGKRERPISAPVSGAAAR